MAKKNKKKKENQRKNQGSGRPKVRYVRESKPSQAPPKGSWGQKGEEEVQELYRDLKKKVQEKRRELDLAQEARLTRQKKRQKDKAASHPLKALAPPSPPAPRPASSLEVEDPKDYPYLGLNKNVFVGQLIVGLNVLALLFSAWTVKEAPVFELFLSGLASSLVFVLVFLYAIFSQDTRSKNLWGQIVQGLLWGFLFLVFLTSLDLGFFVPGIWLATSFITDLTQKVLYPVEGASNGRK